MCRYPRTMETGNCGNRAARARLTPGVASNQTRSAPNLLICNAKSFQKAVSKGSLTLSLSIYAQAM
jgi:hypothetical protein